MPVTLQVVTLLGLAVAIALLLALLLRRPPDPTTLLHQQTGVLADVRERLGALGEATRRLEALGASVADVQALLQVPKLRGTLGEVWLEALLRQVLPPAAFAMQYGFRTGERVDAVLRVGGRLVPVDAKFPLEACRRMLAAADPAERERERRAFLRSVRARVEEIATKYIRPDEGTFEFALMYVPAENVYYEALVGDTALDDADSVIAYALERRVVPVSPHTFYAYLLVILHGLKGMAVEARAREILDGLGALRLQFAALWGAHEKVGTHLQNALRQFEETQRLRGRVEEGFGRLEDA
jgi:DNA recombination protein RmuC